MAVCFWGKDIKKNYRCTYSITEDGMSIEVEYDIEEEIYRRLEDWQKLPLLNEESEIKHFGGILGKNYGRPNFNHFMERAMMMIKPMKGELDIFEKWPYVRRNVLYYTSYYKDKFVRLMLNETEIH